MSHRQGKNRRRREKPARTLPLNRGGPDADVAAPLPLELVSASPDPHMPRLPGTSERYYRLGECTVIVTHNFGRIWHLSIAHHEREPTWNEISQARYRCLPDGVWMAMYFPPRDSYVNVHRFCFQMSECRPLKDDWSDILET
jgi:hypothetical protein